MVLSRLAHPADMEAATDGSGCSLSRRTGEGQGEGHFVRITPTVRHLFLRMPLGNCRDRRWSLWSLACGVGFRKTCRTMAGQNL